MFYVMQTYDKLFETPIFHHTEIHLLASRIDKEVAK
jgi:hypothetical protein